VAEALAVVLALGGAPELGGDGDQGVVEVELVRVVLVGAIDAIGEAREGVGVVDGGGEQVLAVAVVAAVEGRAQAGVDPQGVAGGVVGAGEQVAGDAGREAGDREVLLAAGSTPGRPRRPGGSSSARAAASRRAASIAVEDAELRGAQRAPSGPRRRAARRRV
jgi:hypothetical protein